MSINRIKVAPKDIVEIYINNVFIERKTGEQIKKEDPNWDGVFSLGDRFPTDVKNKYLLLHSMEIKFADKENENNLIKMYLKD